MLIQKPISSGDSVTIKLTSGEEVIARFDSEDDSSLYISKPVTLAGNSQGMSFVPWMISSLPDRIRLNKSAIITYGHTQEQIAKAFIEATSSIKMV
jgi:hypothetical protein